MGWEYSTKPTETKQKYEERKHIQIDSIAGGFSDLSKSQENRGTEKLIDSNSEHKFNEGNDAIIFKILESKILVCIILLLQINMNIIIFFH